MHYLVFSLFELLLDQPLVGCDPFPEEVHVEDHQLGGEEEEDQAGQHAGGQEDVSVDARDRGEEFYVEDPVNYDSYYELQVI